MDKILLALLLILGSIISISVLIILTCIFCEWVIKAVEI